MEKRVQTVMKYISGFQSMVPGPAASASPGGLIKIEISSPILDLVSSRLCTVCVPGSCALRRLPGDFDESSSFSTTRLEAEGDGEGHVEGRGGAKRRRKTVRTV